MKITTIIKKIMPNIKVQRCLVHIPKNVPVLDYSNPTYDAGKELRPLILVIQHIESHNDKPIGFNYFLDGK